METFLRNLKLERQPLCDLPGGTSGCCGLRRDLQILSTGPWSPGRERALRAEAAIPIIAAAREDGAVTQAWRTSPGSGVGGDAHRDKGDLPGRPPADRLGREGAEGTGAATLTHTGKPEGKDQVWKSKSPLSGKLLEKQEVISW